MSAEEAAGALGMTVPAANSALHRARTAVEERSGPPAEPVDEEVLGRYVRAWEAADADALVALMSDEMTAAMPPSPTWYEGRAQFEPFLRGYILPSLREAGARLVRADANGHAAFGFYRGKKLEAIHVVRTRGGKVVALDHFILPALYPVFGLRPTL
jgi:RNA polymerase sigma-70 factor (ECF subfamily)